MNFYLIGLPGSGKSTLGKELAQALNYEFIDLDDAIAYSQNATISDIFNSKGEEYFRIIEQKALHTTQYLTKTVIACGGGTPCFFDNINWINQHGKSIYLKTSVQVILNRLASDSTRPLLKKDKENQLNSLLENRKTYYEKALFICEKPTLNSLLNLIN